MNALLLAMLLAGGTTPAAGPDEIDLRCYRLMADLARAEDPEIRALGLTAASYFLGRIDAAAPGYDVAQPSGIPDSERPVLIRRCGDALGAAGFDLRALGTALPRPDSTV